MHRSNIRLGEYDVSTAIDCMDGICADAPLNLLIEDSIVHPDYNRIERNHDIALVRLASAVEYTEYVQPICTSQALGLQSSPPGTLLMTGWGRTLDEQPVQRKRKVDVPVIEQNVCRERYAKKHRIVESQLCAGALAGIATCQGDSGGPVMRMVDGSWVVEGIVSMGVRCGLEGWPSIYTRLSAFEDWIDQIIRD